MLAVPLSASPASSPVKLEISQQYLPRAATATQASPMILGTSPHIVKQAQIINSPRGNTPLLSTLHLESPQQWSGGRKRPHELIDGDYSEGKSGRKKNEKGGKGLRHFSMKVCEKVQKKGVTSYNEVADELVQEFSDPTNMSPTDQAYDQKNIRRRVYDALNVLMAMNIISKEKKEIRWIGLPTNSAQECQNLEQEKSRRMERIKHKTQQLHELMLQQIAFKNLVERNKDREQRQGTPTANSSIQLPFIVVNTSKKTVIDCSISNDKYEYLFNFDNTFEIHDDIEVLKRMGMAYGLEKGSCSAEDLGKATKLVPKALEPYVLELAHEKSIHSMSLMPGPSGNHNTPVSKAKNPMISQSPLAMPLGSMAHVDQHTDAEVAMAMHGLSRQSSVGSYSDMTHSRETPSEAFSDDESSRSSFVENF